MHNSAAYAALLASNNKRTAQATALVRLACAISFLDMLGYGFLSPITYSLLNKDVIGATGFGALQSVSNAAALLAGAALGRLSDTRGRKPAIVASAALSQSGLVVRLQVVFNPEGMEHLLQVAERASVCRCLSAPLVSVPLCLSPCPHVNPTNLQEADDLDLKMKESLVESELKTAELPAHGV